MTVMAYGGSIASLGLDFLGAAETVSTHPPASRFQVFCYYFFPLPFSHLWGYMPLKYPLTVTVMEVLEREQN